ncbi:MAG: hypothetical protein EZS28_053509 [Streblomastix strix]|uniref:non-specific serine/threonine protein kinase n=1 Tax=Streblomastix strix TaxID=222440 RepID=A0A5J4RAJ1_9EUKA|nr:MAG: hypothetical protein EZS28_053509 [Streblomastix strix]
MSRVPNFLSQSSEDAAVLTRAFCKIIRLIGTGAFGRVYLVDSGDQLSHAAKVMQKANFNKREWEAASRISRNMEKCPFVIRYDGIFEGEKSVIILMEFSNMPSLGNLIDASGKLPDERTVMIIQKDVKQFIKLSQCIGI